jgi:cadmium resistance protein CadD (predicted permease)
VTWIGTQLIIATGAFVATMFDNFVALAAQFGLTPVAQHRRLAYGQFVAVMFIIALAVLVGGILNSIPLRLVGLLAIAPVGYAWSKWTHRGQSAPSGTRRGVVTTALVTVALSGDNIAVWSALFRTAGAGGSVVHVVTYALLDILGIALVSLLARRPLVVAAVQSRSNLLEIPLYLLLSVVILWRCGWF